VNVSGHLARQVPGVRVAIVTTVDMSLEVLLGFQLRRFLKEGLLVTALSSPGPYVAALERDGLRHVPVPELTRSWTPLQDLRATWRMYRIFRSLRPDIVHSHTPKSGVLGRVAGRLAGVPVLVNTVHGLYMSETLSPWRARLVAVAERTAARLSDHELFQSREDYEFAVRTRMVTPERASWLGNGVDLDRFQPKSADGRLVAAIRSSWGASDKDLVVGTVGRLVREKGYLEFFDAARNIAGRRKDVRFVAVGPMEPHKTDALTDGEIEAARRHGIVFHGNGTDMPEIYAAMDVFVLASHREGLPRSPIEASAMERPVVATDIRGCREVVNEDLTGLLVPRGDTAALTSAIDRLLDEPGTRARMGAAGRVRALSNFDEEQIVQRTLSVYRRLLAERFESGPREARVGDVS